MTIASTPALEAAQALFSPQAITDPYPLYAQARALGRELGTDGLLHVPEWNMTLVFSHEVASAVFRSPAALSGQGFAGESETAFPEAMRVLRPMMLFHNGPSHTRLRSLAQAAFTPRVVAQQRELVQTRLDRLLKAAAEKPDFDAVEDLAVPLPVGVITEMLGLSGDDEAKFRQWSGSIAELLGGNNESDVMERVEADAIEMRRYFRGLADELRARPQPGLLSAMAGVEDGGERLSSDELLANAVLLLAAGHETTTNLIASGILTLARQPDAWNALTQNPDLAPGMTEELLRVTSPVQRTGRGLAQDLVVGGQTLRAGSFAALIVAAANRDERVFSDPERLDPARPNTARHLAFASGPHYCLGASLARMEGELVFRTLAERFPAMQVPEQQVQYRPNFVLRGPLALRVQLGAQG
ncbi:cytochrome P450 [Deinococcus sp. KNUC1210]|uniref:cytochrome P450 n=1 Tax=Deinococcus sp. KNUC1210 TaxID=2917691 RepID=UPI001EEF8F2C|nr:cytochrome P450 [Deinococcus sp. KNUC1210]ULH15632.1 cytochrome P450 [Deinococcus sp. KNUC1210]